MTDSEHKVKWGDDCPVCGAKKSIIAGIDPKDKKVAILRCMKCKTTFNQLSK